MFPSVSPAAWGRPKPYPSFVRGWGFAALVLALSATESKAQPTAAGTRITSIARVSYETATGLTFVITADPVPHTVIVAQVAGVDVDPSRASVGDPGSTVTFAHTIKNIGNGSDNFVMSARSTAGWPVRVYIDANANGLVDPSDQLAVQPVALAAGASASLLVAADVPAQAVVRGKTDSIQLTGASVFDSRVNDTVLDQLQVRNAGVVVALAKTVDRATATVGEMLTYSVVYSASGQGSGSNFRLFDAIPLGTTYVPGTLRLNGQPLTDAGGDDAGVFDAIKNHIAVSLPAIAGGDRGTVTFQVRVER